MERGARCAELRKSKERADHRCVECVHRSRGSISEACLRLAVLRCGFLCEGMLQLRSKLASSLRQAKEVLKDVRAYG